MTRKRAKEIEQSDHMGLDVQSEDVPIVLECAFDMKVTDSRRRSREK